MKNTMKFSQKTKNRTISNSVQFSHSVMADSLWPHGLQHAWLPYPSPTNSWNLLKLVSIRLVVCTTISSSVVPFSSFLQSFPEWGFFKWVFFFFFCIRWAKYWNFSFNISPSNEHPGLISFRMDWLDLLAFQGTLKSLLQNHGSKASILWCSAFFTVQLSHPYITTGKTIALTKWIFDCKWISLLFNTIWSSNSTPGYKFRKKLNSHLERYMHPNAYSRTSHNRQDMEATQMPINSYIKTIWLRKCSINIHNGILFIQKEMKFFYCSKVNEPREFYA